MKLTTNTFFIGSHLPVLSRLPEESLNLVYFDPPQGNAWDLKVNEKLRNDFYFQLTQSLQQIYRLLNNNGSLYIHSPVSNESVDIRFLVSQVFGKSADREFTILRRMPLLSSPGKRNETILVFAKSNRFVMNEVFRPLTNDEINRRHPRKDARGVYEMHSLTRAETFPGMRFEWRGIIPPEGQAWIYRYERLEALFNAGEIVLAPRKPPRLKRYLKELQKLVGDFWEDLDYLATNSEFRSGLAIRIPGLLQVYKRILQFGSNENDFVLGISGNTTFLCAAANTMKRQWAGIVPSEAAIELFKAAAGEDSPANITLMTEAGILEEPAFEVSDRSILRSITDIKDLQLKVQQLDTKIQELKRNMNLEGEDTEAILAEMQKAVDSSLIMQTGSSSEKYIALVRAWLNDWAHLDRLTQELLPSGELLLDLIRQARSSDYSPFILQYCRSLENEILRKIFVSYNHDFNQRIVDPDVFLAYDLENEKTKKFATTLKKRNTRYTLGDMHFILNLITSEGNTFRSSPILQDFKKFVLSHFQKAILDEQFLLQIKVIIYDYRNKAAHPDLLDLDLALKCQSAVRECINTFLLNYISKENSANK